MLYRGRVADVSTARENAVPYNVVSAPDEKWGDKRTISGLESSPVAELFFSQENVNALQDGIRWRVYADSDGRFTISRQSETELKIVMRSVFLQDSRNEPFDVVPQVRELNATILDFCVPRIIQEIRTYKTYQRDISTLPEPMARGEMATSKGTRVLDMRRY